MLDVHPPHKSIEGVGEFFLHLFTITVGLLIAVGIEAAVERHQHRELASEARDTMTAEIRKNDKSVADALKDIDQEQQKVKRNLAETRKVQLNAKDPASRNLSLGIHAVLRIREIFQYLSGRRDIFKESGPTRRGRGAFSWRCS